MARARRRDREKNSGKGARILIVEARFYDDIADALLAGATKVLKQAGARFDCLTVPGSLEIPGAIAIGLAEARRRRRGYDGVVARCCVITGHAIPVAHVAHPSDGGV